VERKQGELRSGFDASGSKAKRDLTEISEEDKLSDLEEERAVSVLVTKWIYGERRLTLLCLILYFLQKHESQGQKNRIET